MNNNDERDYAEETANRAAMLDDTDDRDKVVLVAASGGWLSGACAPAAGADEGDPLGRAFRDYFANATLAELAEIGRPRIVAPRKPDDPRRAAVVAGIRALADLIETDTSLPVPNSVHAQHSLDGLDDNGRQLMRDIAEHLGIDPSTPSWEPNHMIDEPGFASVRLEVAGGHTPEDGSYRVTYVVHGAVREPAE